MSQPEGKQAARWRQLADLKVAKGRSFTGDGHSTGSRAQSSLAIRVALIWLADGLAKNPAESLRGLASLLAGKLLSLIM